MTRVSLLKCEDYEARSLKEKVLEGLSLIGLDPSMFEGKRVLLKPNLLSATPVEKAVVTHPEFFRAVVRLVKSHGGRPVMAESPAFQPLNRVMKKTGYDRVVAEEGCEIADPGKTAVLFYEGPLRYRRFELSGALFDADIVLNLPKFKTHSLTYVTGAVKNLFGFIHGLDKSRWHVKAPTRESFSDFLLDLYLALLKGFERPKTFVHMMDAVMGMEGDGPGTTGVPRKIGALLFGTDAVAVDAVAVGLVGLDKDEAKTLTLGEERGLGMASLEKIDIRGSRMEDFHIHAYVPPSSGSRSHMDYWPLSTNLFKNLVVERPVPSEARCTLCYQCKTICPGGAIEGAGEREATPRFDYEKCIRCFCCMEVCPEAAIRLKRGRLQWIMDRWV
ncbi:MAG: DUF362 domain-containing protein [Desulfobacterales bacterium]|nr:DUF362 domain-containing protein [Desulfobacterales bacterium]